MGTLLARDTITKAQRLLHDLHGVNWPLDELLGWLNEGQIKIVHLRPDASSEVKAVLLVAGIQQSMPAQSIRLLGVRRNTNGRACSYIERSAMDAFNPDWVNATASPTVKHWMYDEQVPSVFDVYPPQPVSEQGSLDIVRSVLPVSCTLNGVSGGSVNSVIGVPDQYESSLVDYCVYRSYSKDAEYTVRGGKADQAWNHFLQGIGVQLATDKKHAPRNNAPPHMAPGATA